MSATTAARTRALQYGEIGTAAFAYLSERGFDFEGYSLIPSSQQYIVANVAGRFSASLAVSCPSELIAFFSPQSLPLSRHPCLGVFISLCANESPVQICTSDIVVSSLLKTSCAAAREHYDSARRTRPTADALSLSSLFSDPATREKYFPYKRHHLASPKANVHFSSLLVGLRHCGVLQQAEPLILCLAGKVSDDQICSVLLHWYGLSRSVGAKSAAEFTISCVLHPGDAKGLGTAFKSLGMGGNAIAAQLIEGQCLLGRGVGEVDLKNEAALRCDQEWVDSQVLNADIDELRGAVRSILEEELGGRSISFSALDSFWDRRWQWCVNGAHTTAVDAKAGIDSKTVFTGASRYYRRMFAEAVEHEPITDWDGAVSVSASAKLEHGKTRVIFACDTLSYFAFEHLLGPVAAAWQQRRVVLDPGRFGALGMCERVNGLRGRGGVNVMLDYDDFNSHHSLETQKMLFEETIKYVGYPKNLGDKLVSSFDNMYMRTPTGLLRVRGTLMSGHRGTTFINSVLNAAYIRCALGRTAYSKYGSLHVGDDVYMCAPVMEDAVSVLAKCKSYGCRMNPSKQSVGTECAEFLRMAITPTHARGYLARAVASAVSGNWTTEARLDAEDGLRTMTQIVRSLINRGSGADYATVLAPAVAGATRLPLRRVRLVLSGEYALGEGPSFGGSSYLRRYEFKRLAAAGDKQSVPPEWPEHATNAYLTRAAAPIERRALEIAAVSVKSAMLDSSYKKTLAGAIVPEPRSLCLVERKPRQLRGAEDAVELLKRPAPRGVLEKYPLLQLVKNHLTTAEVRVLLRMAGGDFYSRDVTAVAWGQSSVSKVIRGVLPYSDASSLASRSDADVIYCTYPVHH